MSRAAEEAHAKWFAQHWIDCEERFVVGATVYRVNWDRVEEGVVRRVERFNVTRSDGDHPVYYAQFGGTNCYNGTWVDQTWAWKFFWTEVDARKELVKTLRDRIQGHNYEIKQIEKLIASLIHPVEEASK